MFRWYEYLPWYRRHARRLAEATRDVSLVRDILVERGCPREHAARIAREALVDVVRAERRAAAKAARRGPRS
jgi:hypothetical protein